MMPPYAFRLSRPTKSYSHSNINSHSLDPHNPHQTHDITSKAGYDTMSEFPRYPIQQPVTTMSKNNTFSDKMWDNEHQIQTQTTLLFTFEKQKRELTKFLESIGIQMDHSCRQETLIETILTQVKPSIKLVLEKNRHLEIKSEEDTNRIQNQEDTIRYLQQTNKLLQSNESHIKHKFQRILREWEEKCKEIVRLHEEIEMKDQELERLRGKTESLSKEVGRILANEETVNRQILEENKKRVSVEKEFSRLRSQRELESQEREMVMSEQRSGLAESSVRMKVTEEKLRALQNKYLKLKSSHTQLLKHSDQRENFLLSKIQGLQQQLHNELVSTQTHHETERELKERLFTFENQNQELKVELSELTTRFLKLKQFQTLDRPIKRSIDSNE